MKRLSLQKLIGLHGWADVPQSVTTREGYVVETSTDRWYLPYTTRGCSTLDFAKISLSHLRWTIKRSVQEKIQTVSTHAGLSLYRDLVREVIKYQKKYALNQDINFGTYQTQLISLFERVIALARAEHRLWALYRVIQWYIWCAENYPELGYCAVYALELEAIRIPGNPKGEAVRMEDLESGPLHRMLELPLLLKALKEDTSCRFEHLQQKAVIALSLALGRNPANLTWLREADLINLTPDAVEPCYILKMPRIKKRQLNPRDELLDEYLDPEFVQHLLALIEANQAIETKVKTDRGWFTVARPLIINTKLNQAALRAGLWEESFHTSSEKITLLLKGFVERHEIISPLTKGLLAISTRRLRYSLATNLANEGISRAELARILDHTDTQHVQVYFETAGNIVEHLDKAIAKGYCQFLDYFNGQVIDHESHAINGDRTEKHLDFIDEDNPYDRTSIGVCGLQSICHLDPPFSCYLCPKFQPYRNADHEHVLDCLLASREKRIQKYKNARLGVQLDDVIMAVAQVVEVCSKGTHA